MNFLAGSPFRSPEDIVALPAFPAARGVYLDRFLGVYGDDPFLVRLLIESGRFLVYHLCVVLQAAHDPARRETWFTVGKLKQTIQSFGLGVSGRQVDHLVARLRAVEFLDVESSPLDRRVRILRPTERMLAHDRDWLAAHHAPLCVLRPDIDYDPVMRRDPAFQVLQRQTVLEFLPLGARLLMAVPDMMLFFHRAAGHMILAALLQAALQDRDQPHSAVSYTDIGDRFGVSRTHVRQLLVAAEELGLVRLMARGGRKVEILPRLLRSYDLGIAGGMFLHDIVFAATLDKIRGRPDATGGRASDST